MAAPKRYMITSALPYANGPLHIGHIAGAYLPADIYVRYLRGRGRDVVWICGSDEHGAAITLRAKKEGTTPREIVDRYHGQISQAFKDFGMEFDLYHRTSSEEHHANAQAFFTQLNNQGSFEVKTSEQYYDAAQQQFLADRYITGECPNCGNPNAYGDQCERCGKDLSPTDLINPKSTLSGEAPELRETSLWYLPMDRHEGWLKEWVETGKFEDQDHHNPADWKNHVLGQCRSWIDGGLKARAMTRDLDWGVPVPVEGADGKVLYVWLDAPIGYISATQEWARQNGKDWEPYWKDEDTQLVHFIGKDNIVFHCIIFPILLKEHGGYILPTNVPANEFMNLENDKISTSRNWAVWLHEYLEEFPGKQDELRYVLCAIMPEQRDSEFTWTDYRDRVNNELADVLGNFMNRAVVLTHKYYGGEVPTPNALQPEDHAALDELAAAPEKIADLIERYRFREAQLEAMNVARLGNRYLADAEPWKLQKTDPERVKTIMHTTLQIAANCAVLLEPFLPNTCAKIREALHLNTPWDGAGGVLLEPGQAIDKLPILFQKVDEEVIEAQRAKLAAGKPQEVNVEPAKDPIAFEQFVGLDIRVATILEAEAVPKTKKLLKLKVDTGIDQRTVVSGIAEHYAPEDIIGQQVSLLVNLEPRKIRGVESQGMILMAEDAEGKLRFVAPTEAMGPGSTIR
ncbi:MAG: methionine--tRNA ligase [Flavobacteriales bacterium]